MVLIRRERGGGEMLSSRARLRLSWVCRARRSASICLRSRPRIPVVVEVCWGVFFAGRGLVGGMSVLGSACDRDIAMARLRSESDSEPSESCVRSMGVDIVLVLIVADDWCNVGALNVRKVEVLIFLICAKVLLMTG